MKDKGSPLTIKDGVVVKCEKNATEVVIPEGVRKIGKNAFDRCESLVSVTIPESVTEIYKGVFRWCDALSEVRYGGTKEQFVHIEGVSYLNSRLVGTGALCVDGTLKLEERTDGFRMFGSMVYSHTDNDPVALNIPESATKIGDWAFFDSKLTSLMIPSSVMEIGKFAFAECESLTDIRFGGTMAQWEAVKKRANWYLHTPVRQVKCSDGEVPLPPYTIKNGVLEVWYRNDTELVIPESVVRIGECAFSGCGSLISVTIPESVAEIDNLAFENCKSLASVELPKSLRRIGSEVFFGCDALAEVRYCGTKGQFVHIEGLVVYYNRNLFDAGVLCADGTLKLWERADGFRMFGSMVCGHTTDKDPVTLNIPEGATKIGGHALWNRPSVMSLTIPNSVKEIDEFAFSWCCSLVSVTLPEGIEKIGNWAFGVCSALVSVTIPKTVREIGYVAFTDCKSLTDIRFGGTMAQWDAVKKKANWYLHTPVIQVKCSDGEVPLPPYTIKNGVLEVWYRNDTELVIPESVVRIGECAFSGCGSLISVTIPESVAEIDEYAFTACDSLTKVMLSENIAKIGDSAFADCTSLAEIRYGGTKAQWEAVKKGEGWNSGIPTKIVHYSDGDATL